MRQKERVMQWERHDWDALEEGKRPRGGANRLRKVIKVVEYSRSQPKVDKKQESESPGTILYKCYTQVTHHDSCPLLEVLQNDRHKLQQW